MALIIIIFPVRGVATDPSKHCVMRCIYFRIKNLNLEMIFIPYQHLSLSFFLEKTLVMTTPYPAQHLGNSFSKTL